ncbi:MAG TPA: hypothetical protein VLG10_02855 [Methylomirabilota bacterium]|nr:hypothetical protein [Methylomirabilota bacterium]
MALWVAVLLVVVASSPAAAGIVVHITDAADKDAAFWVETKSSHALIHGSTAKTLDERFMRPGETATISVLALNPVTFVYVYASIYHPAYLYDTKLVRQMPSALKTVTIPSFAPRAWRDFIDSGTKVLHAGQGIHLMNVVSHFKLFIKPYLPALDKEGVAADLPRYIPLFEELISHTEKTLPLTTYGDKTIDDRRRTDPAYARALEQTEQRQLQELRNLLAEIKALLAMSGEERIRLRSAQARLVNTRSVYHELMTAQDRQRIEEFLDFQFENSRRHPRPEKSRQWVSSGTAISYSITLGDRYALKDKDAKRLYENCYRTGLNIDLSGGEKTALTNMQKRLDANFCRNDKEEWVIQLPRK